MDEHIANFVAITGASETQAGQFLQLSDGNLENAIQLFFESPDLASAAAAPPAAQDVSSSSNSTARAPAARSRRYREGDDGVVHIPSDDDDEDDADFDMTEDEPDRQPQRQIHADVDADAEMARKLQEEFYTAGGGTGAGNGGDDVDEEGYRAPMQRTTETLVGPDAEWGSDPGDMRAAIAQQLRMREQVRRGILQRYP